MRKSTWILLSLVIVLLTACGPVAQPDVADKTAGGDVFMIALPRIEITLDQNGQPSILGINIVEMARSFGADLSGIGMPKATLDQLLAAGVQHLEVRQVGSALEIWANGKMLPHIGWTDESLAMAGQMAKLANVSNADTIAGLLPIVRRLGLDVLIRLPVPAGTAEVPLAPAKAPVLAAAAPVSPTAVVRSEIKYDANGVPSILGVSAVELEKQGISVPGHLTSETIAMMQANNIQNIELSIKTGGVTVYVNGKALPNVIWDEEMLRNVAELYNKMQPANQYEKLVDMAPPFVQKADVGILVHMPLATGEAPIAVKMH